MIHDFKVEVPALIQSVLVVLPSRISLFVSL